MRAALDLTAARWRKSSYSNQDGGACVEVADGCPGVVPVRDSKSPTGPILPVSASAWRTFVSAVNSGSLSSS
ncbi:DUF397 domain-containing protein [Streptomyces himalayensis]|uniref:DUF397 domain-containing protein n=1 Tax=Streptomyces himalayensis subsp. himalayensis TaxID=2756131 RepID=A0A7W0IDG3_9ACTN|nr:DUF397 domain-containing protein [Streptomyces himalayensis]MBA2951036.1 DUF397 domain-containing protein [Streptomyces himalayensis subsp. himalayensis]